MKFLKVENFSEFEQDFGKLAEEHFKGCENSAYHDKYFLDTSMFQQLIDQESFFLYLCEVDDIVSGYVGYFDIPHPLYSENLVSIDFLFVKPEYRGNNIAENMVKFVESLLKEQGVGAVKISLPYGEKFDSMSKYLGYSPDYSIHIKSLENN